MLEKIKIKRLYELKQDKIKKQRVNAIFIADKEAIKFLLKFVYGYINIKSRMCKKIKFMKTND